MLRQAVAFRTRRQGAYLTMTRRRACVLKGTDMTDTPRYSAIAILLHWIIAALLIGMVFFG